MANRFDFELKADDQVSASIKAIDDSVKNLLPKLDQTSDKLKLGGRASFDGLDGIGSKFNVIARNARQSVQFIGDIVPPLKMVTGLSLGLGGVGAAVNQIWKGVKDFGDTGYRINSVSKSISQTTDAFQKLTGAMVENGASRDEAVSSIVGMYDRANAALSGEDNVFTALLNQQGIYISKTKDGVADVNKLMDDLSARMQSMNGAQQALFVKKLGGNDDLLNYLRLSADEVKRLKDQAQRDGLVFSDKDIQNALEFRKQMNQVSASWDGMLLRSQAFLGQGQFVKDQVSQIADLMKNADRYSVAHFFSMGQDNGKDYDWMRRAAKDEDFKKTLTDEEKLQLSFGYLSSSLRDKLQGRYQPGEQADQLQKDILKITAQPASLAPVPSGAVDPNSRSVRNNNPWNLNFAGQSGARLETGVEQPRFVTFQSPDQGIAAADKQLQLYFSGQSAAAGYQPLQTLQQIISTASPRADGNKTDQMIASASRELGIDANAPLNLSDVDMRSRVLNALFNQEGNNSYNPEKIKQILSSAAVNAVRPEQQETPPARPSLVATSSQNAQAADPQQVASAVSEALKDSKMQVKLTLINGQTGQRKTITTSGPKVTTSMTYQ